MIFRIYEAYNKQTDVTVSLGFVPKHAVLCDLMENEGSPLAVDGTSFSLSVKPFEIVTIKVKR